MILKIFNSYLFINEKELKMSSKCFITAFVFTFLFLLSGILSAQDSSKSTDSPAMKMNKSMNMENGRMETAVNPEEIDLKAIDQNRDGKVYQCPMDFDVISDKPGKDPKCGMELEEVSVEKAAANLISKGFRVKGESNTDSIVREGLIDLNAIDSNKDGRVYEDMMDYNVISDAPGTCPLCGMTLKEVSLEKAKTNLIMNGFKVK
jgi:hypothetical protein